MDKRIQKYKLFIFVMKNVLVSKLFMKEREQILKHKNIYEKENITLGRSMCQGLIKEKFPVW